jgi:hypothetical protein
VKRTIHVCFYNEFRTNHRIYTSWHTFTASNATPINLSTLVTQNFHLLRVKNAASSCFHEYCFDGTNNDLTDYIYTDLVLCPLTSTWNISSCLIQKHLKNLENILTLLYTGMISSYKIVKINYDQSKKTDWCVCETVVRGPPVVLGFCPCGPLTLNISPKKTEKY